MKKLSRRNLSFGLASVGVIAALKPNFSIAGDRPTIYSKIGQAAPTFNLAKNGGGRFNNASLRGKVTIVEFWGLWCPDCLADAPYVAQLANMVKSERGINFVSVHTRGRYGRWGTIDAYFAEKQYSYPVAIDDDNAAYNAFGLEWVPSFIIIDSNGIIRDYATDLVAGNGIGANGVLAKARRIRDARRRR